MRCFVTGASGFIGANLVHELLAQGHSVRALFRPGADIRGLDGADFDAVEGDVTDKSESLARQMQGCDWLFHVAASYALWLPDYRPMYRTNLVGTQKILKASVAAGISRVVYTSTVGCIGLPRKSADGRITPTDETTPVSEVQMTNHYKRSKWQAEVAAREAARAGVPVVIVNPTAPVGPRDVKPTPTGQFIVDYLNRAMPAYLDTGLNWVPVRDVAKGHILAAEKGLVGERYILGHAEGNWSMRHALEVLSQLTGLPMVKREVPWRLALLAAHGSELLSSFTGKPPRAPIAGVRMARYKMWFNPDRAIRELGLPQTSPRQALADAVEWFTQNGYVKPRPTPPRPGR
jgi:dihydroflavonol-4-reductase